MDHRGPRLNKNSRTNCLLYHFQKLSGIYHPPPAPTHPMRFLRELIVFFGKKHKQECIPVGCVLPAAVAVTGDPPEQAPPPEQTPPPEQAPPEQALPRSRHPPWNIHPPGQIPINFPLGCGSGPDPPQLPPWVWA